MLPAVDDIVPSPPEGVNRCIVSWGHRQRTGTPENTHRTARNAPPRFPGLAPCPWSSGLVQQDWRGCETSPPENLT